MNQRDEIREIASAVNDGLTVYIATHDAIFREGSTLKSLLKNIFGRAVPMSTLLEESERLLPLWHAIHKRIEDFRRSAYSSLSQEEKRYFDILSRYVEAVRETVAVLVDRQRLLNQGSISGPSNPLTREALQQKERIYRESVRQYMAIGEELNSASPVIFG